MTKLTYTRKDILALSIRLENRGAVSGRVEAGQRASDLGIAARLLRKMLAQGMPPTSFEIDPDEANGSSNNGRNHAHKIRASRHRPLRSAMPRRDRVPPLLAERSADARNGRPD